jgi:hypothetical protein
MASAHGIFFTYDPGDNSRVACSWRVSEEVFDQLKAELTERLGPPSHEHIAPASLLDQFAALDSSVTM